MLVNRSEARQARLHWRISDRTMEPSRNRSNVVEDRRQVIRRLTDLGRHMKNASQAGPSTMSAATTSFHGMRRRRVGEVAAALPYR